MDSVQQAFNNLKQEGWSTENELKWGFTFFGKNAKELLMVFAEIEAHDYVLEQLEFREDLKCWILYVTKIEKLGFRKLHRRNLAFEKLADYCKVESYDGWSVEQIEEI